MKRDPKDAALILLMMACCLGIGGSVGFGLTDRMVRDEAVKAGVGQWVCDPKEGKIEFQWVKPGEVK
jgi:hypothetical protein